MKIPNAIRSLAQEAVSPAAWYVAAAIAFAGLVITLAANWPKGY